MTKKVFINNVEYNTMFRYKGVDTDKLCGIFMELRASKNGEKRYNPTEKLKHYKLLKARTSLTRCAIEKYIPILIELGLVRLEADGGVHIIGFNSSFNQLRTDEKKLIRIPIQKEKSYIKTALNVAYVRIKSNLKHQQTQIDKKYTQTKLLKKYVYQQQNPHKNILTKKELKASLKLIEKYGSVDKLLSTYCEQTILSQKGFSRLNKNKDGKYFKKQLIQKNLIQSEIREEVLLENIEYKEYLKVKSVLIFNYHKGIIWCPKTKCVYLMLTSSVKDLG